MNQDYNVEFGDMTTRKQRMSKKQPKKQPRQKTLIERWYNGKVYIHLPLVPFKIRIA